MAIRTWCLMVLAVVFLAGLTGCASKPLPPPPEMGALPPAPSENADQARLKAALTSGDIAPAEAAEISERLLAEGSVVTEQDLARLELVLLKSLNKQDKTHRATLLRSLGIIHYHQKKYKQAQQELQNSNELNPKSARTHYYLARLFANQGQIFESKGKQKVSRQQYKRASIEMEQARKLEPSNSLYRQDVKQLVAPGNGQ